MTDLQAYFNSLQEGDNITVTADLLNAMEQALRANKIYERALKLSVAHQVVFVRPLLFNCYLLKAEAEIEQEEQNNGN